MPSLSVFSNYRLSPRFVHGRPIIEKLCRISQNLLVEGKGESYSQLLVCVTSTVTTAFYRPNNYNKKELTDSCPAQSSFTNHRLTRRLVACWPIISKFCQITQNWAVKEKGVHYIHSVTCSCPAQSFFTNHELARRLVGCWPIISKFCQITQNWVVKEKGVHYIHPVKCSCPAWSLFIRHGLTRRLVCCWPIISKLHWISQNLVVKECPAFIG